MTRSNCGNSIRSSTTNGVFSSQLKTKSSVVCETKPKGEKKGNEWRNDRSINHWTTHKSKKEKKNIRSWAENGRRFRTSFIHISGLTLYFICIRKIKKGKNSSTSKRVLSGGQQTGTRYHPRRRKKKKEEKKMFDSVKVKRSKVEHFHSAGIMINAFVQLYISSIIFFSFYFFFLFFLWIIARNPKWETTRPFFSTVFLFYYVI